MGGGACRFSAGGADVLVLGDRRSRRLGSAGSIASSRSSSSCWSQAVRSTVLDLELQLERERREAAEKELAELRARLAMGKGSG
mmetsp:Transcript_122538/g.354172  ORF Transcript_122538/g.354172 Transcript_122538/m.354172 type:complete len:84 (+) Transcript_122538:2-253(+)